MSQTGISNVSLGRVVHYRSRTDKYTCAAIVNATQPELYQPNVDAGFIEGVSGPDHVHLTVLSAGKPGKRAAADDFVGDRADAPVAENNGVGYTEWDVPFDAQAVHTGTIKPGYWAWPPRV